jgi:hypothetical protein
MRWNHAHTLPTYFAPAFDAFSLLIDSDRDLLHSSLPRSFGHLSTLAFICRHEAPALFEALLVTIFRKFPFEQSECLLDIAAFNEYLDHVGASLSGWFAFVSASEWLGETPRTPPVRITDGFSYEELTIRNTVQLEA